MDTPKPALPDDDAPYNPDPHAHPGLHVIAVIEGVKGLLGLIAASGLALGGPEPVRHVVHLLIHRFHLDPHQGAAAWLDRAVNPSGIHIAVAVAAAYGVLHIAEGWGLWRDKAWASWLGCIGAALYLPFDIYALVRHPGHWMAWAVVVINLIVVYVLGRDLMKRHAHPPLQNVPTPR